MSTAVKSTAIFTAPAAFLGLTF